MPTSMSHLPKKRLFPVASGSPDEYTIVERRDDLQSHPQRATHGSDEGVRNSEGDPLELQQGNPSERKFGYEKGKKYLYGDSDGIWFARGGTCFCCSGILSGRVEYRRQPNGTLNTRSTKRTERPSHKRSAACRECRFLRDASHLSFVCLLSSPLRMSLLGAKRQSRYRLCLCHFREVIFPKILQFFPRPKPARPDWNR